MSVLTPIGTALLGLTAGQTMNWTARDDRQHKLKVLAVAGNVIEKAILFTVGE
ncbi:GreA/GreB family elongation factor [Rhizobium giardinii]|uniref:GreA/GreB family elongation factor n=1 Tax=Rhizobium giardinii TaxID=56731 RepID=UPI003084165E